LQDESFVTLYNLIPNLQTIQNEYQDALSAVVAFMRQSQTALTKGETVTPPVDSHIGVMKTADNEFEFAYNHNGIFFILSATLVDGSFP
jgi:hypothetical protein